MLRIDKALAGCVLGLVGVVAYADPMCDCSKIIGQCAASIKMKSLTGSAPSYSANYSITSTTAICSKVSYYIDSTPYFNVLANTNTVEDSAFGTSPISIKNFSEIRCDICAKAGQQSSAPAEQPAAQQIDSGISQFIGTWSGTLRWALASDPITIYIEPRGGRLGGRVIGKSGTSEFTSVRVNGNVLTYNFIGVDGGTYSYTMELQGERSAKVSSEGLFNFSGAVVKSQ